MKTSLFSRIVSLLSSKKNNKKGEEKNQNSENTGSRNITTNFFENLLTSFNTGVSKKIFVMIINLFDPGYSDGEAILEKRGSEINEIFNLFGKRKYRNVIICGEEGIGRYQLIEGIAQAIKEGACPKKFKDSQFFEVPTEQFSPKTNSSYEIATRIRKLSAYVKNNPNTIIYFSNMFNIVRYGLVDFFATLIFDDAICIGIMTNDELENSFAMKSYFYVHYAVEPPKKDLYALLAKGKIKKIEQFHNVTITSKAFEEILDETLVATYVTKVGDVLDIADTAASIAENHELKEVDIKSILETDRYNINIMLNRPKEVNDFYAIHEAGHAIVALHYGVGIEVITIIPKNNGETGGFNLFEIDNNSLDSKEDVLRRIEIALGGYVGTLFRGYPLTYGASGDLIKVSDRARAMFLYFGMEEGNPISYLNEKGQIDLNYLSDKMTFDLSKNVKDVISMSLENAKNIIQNDDKNFAILTEAIKKKGFLTKSEILALYNGEMSIDEIPDINDLIFKD